jgi:2-polyprenyl-3-methyl-5-hydroxy-6-metoxy-1,4-benzoquinol methylase
VSRRTICYARRKFPALPEHNRAAPARLRIPTESGEIVVSLLKDLAKKNRVLRYIWGILTCEKRRRATGIVLREMVEYCAFEVSSIRRLLRHMVADHPSYLAWIEQTRGSFDYQWDKLPKSDKLLSNPDFIQIASDLVCSYTGLPPSWFPGKKVLDAGCGNGRFSWALAKLGADVTAFDLSTHGTTNLRRLAWEASLSIRVFQHNVLDPIPLDASFDLVWSFGVLHHTGNTYRAFQNIHPLVREDGYLFLMLYGEPRMNRFEDFRELNQYERLRRKTENLDYAGKIQVLQNDPLVGDVHGWFDAISPCINDLYSFEEIEAWLQRAGFCHVRATLESRNHFVISQKAARVSSVLAGPSQVDKAA